MKFNFYYIIFLCYKSKIDVENIEKYFLKDEKNISRLFS
jgi:hypothetical protein